MSEGRGRGEESVIGSDRIRPGLRFSYRCILTRSWHVFVLGKDVQKLKELLAGVSNDSLVNVTSNDTGKTALHLAVLSEAREGAGKTGDSRTAGSCSNLLIGKHVIGSILHVLQHFGTDHGALPAPRHKMRKIKHSIRARG